MNKELINKKLEYWENQLLDLGKRNKMISFKETKRTTLKILDPEFNTLYTKLVMKEEALTFQKSIDKDSDIRVYSVLLLMDSLSAPVEVRLGDIKTAGTIEESKKTLKNLRSKARLSLDEQGTNILYLVFGFIEWREKGSKNDTWIKSPLILVPVSLGLESLNAPYTLKRYEDDLVVNPTLAYLFEKDYGITLPNFDPDDDSLDDFMDSMEELVDLRGWKVVRETSLGLVSFSKISMYKDLLANEDDIKRNPIIQAFAGDASALNSKKISEIDFDHDNKKSTELYQVVNADSSQQDAILLSQKGISFVMQGPPGTGKSQTITNIIAQGLADEKKILFVSEKMAALEVVHRRLEEVRLADFCLALHSHKANKKDILEHLEHNLNLKRKNKKVKDEELEKLTRLDVLRESLKGYVEDIHKVIMPLEMSLYEVYGAILEIQELPDIKVSLAGIGDYSRDKVNRLCLLVENLEKTRSALGTKWYKNPWQGITIARLGNVQKQELRDKISTILWLLDKVPEIFITNNTRILEICNLDNISVYYSAFTLADRCEKAPQEWIGKDLSRERKLLAELDRTKKLIDNKKNKIDTYYKESFLDVNENNFCQEYENKCRELRGLIRKDYGYGTLFSDYLKIRMSLYEYFTLVKKVETVSAKLNEAYSSSCPVDSLKQLELLLDICDILFEKARLQEEIDKIDKDVLEDYEISIYDIDVKGMLKRFKNQYSELLKILNVNYTDTFIDAKVDAFCMPYENNCETLRNLLRNDFTNDNLFVEYSQVNVNLQKFYNICMNLDLLITKLNKAYCIGNTDDSIEHLKLLLNICEILLEKKKTQDEINKMDETILEECEKTIFEIDYENMLNRFKVDYTGFFKIFKKQYHNDVKQLRLAYKNVKKKVLNDEAIGLLQRLKKRNELIVEKQGELDKIKAMLGVNQFADMDSVLTSQEINEVRNLITGLKEYRNQYPRILQSEIGDMILKISAAQNALKKLETEIATIKSYLKTERKYSAIKADLIHLSELQYKTDMEQLLSSYKKEKKRLLYDKVISLLEQLQKRNEFIIKKKKMLDKVNSKLGVNQFADMDSVLTVQEVNEVKKLISDLKKYKTKYPNILQNEIKDMILKISTAQNVINELEIEINVIKSYLKIERKYSDVKEDLLTVSKYKLANIEYKKLLLDAKSAFKFTVIDKDTDWNSLISLLSNFDALATFPQKTGTRMEWIQFIFNKSKANEVAAVRKYLLEIVRKKSIFDDFIEIFDKPIKSKLREFDKLKVRAEKCLAEFDSIDEWIDYRNCKTDCEKSGLENFVLQSEDIVFPEGKLNKVFLKAFYYSWLANKMSVMKSISDFNARIHSDNVEEFKKLDLRQLPVAQMRIREKLINGLPDKSMFNRTGDEMSVLLHELGKKRKIMPLRKLFRSIPNLLLKLKPCLMMSPLSVSYFLEADTYKFDMVIFDEASQIFPQDAIGAIFRGSQVIIAGDSKQLPPTNFFSANTNNDSGLDFDDDDDEEDEIISDSILEEAASAIPNRSLLWHYRSRYEDLISFSNQEIYGNNLITFPSSKINEKDTGVEYIYVPNGVCENRCNKKEAERCIQIIEQHIKKYPNRSLGVIAFSKSQQSTIEESIQEFRKKHREYDSFFTEDKEEAFFIKNLENVQGDERDTIIFSICYGKNAQGRMYMRFGPLGHQGGERRLNVAITRAKYNVKLVGSIQPEDIDLDKTKSEGVKMLRSYIEFASRTVRTATPHKQKNVLYETDIFSNNVAKFLEQQGYKVKKNIGSSDYTIDIAIEHPEIDGAYIAGIECDGDSYQKARTVRDRDHLRGAVMERMGWKMYRIWSTEWIQNEQGAKLKLIEFISDALENYSSSQKIEHSASGNIEIATEEVVRQQSQEKNMNPDNPYNLDRYQEYHWRNVKTFRTHNNESQIADRIHNIVQVEQPIHLKLLYKRMAGYFGNEKVTDTIRNTVNDVIKQKIENQIQIDGDSFITLIDFSTPKVRRSLPGSPDRSIEYIPLKEIEEAMKIVLSGAFGVETSALILETARIFGFEKAGIKIRKKLMIAIESLKAKGYIRVSDDRVQLLED